MIDKYRICLIQPQGYPHSQCFQEIALLLESSLNAAGADCDMKDNEFARDRINVILGYHLITFDEALLRFRYVPYQLEQLEAKEGWYSENVRLMLENAHEVFRRLQPRDAEADEVIFDMKEEATSFFFIEQGRAELWRPGLYDDELQLTKVLTPGDYFGEEALVVGGQRNARVKMTERSRLLVLDKKDFDELINAPMIDRVSAKVAHAMLEEGARLLDVRYEDEYEMKIVRNMKNLRSRGWTWYKIMMKLNTNNIPTKKAS